MSAWQARRHTGARGAAALVAAVALAVAAAACADGGGGARKPGGARKQGTQAGLVVSTADGQVRGKQVGRTGEDPRHPPRRAAGRAAALGAAAAARALEGHPACHVFRAAFPFPQPQGVFGRPSTTENCLYLNVFLAGQPAFC